TVNYHLISHPEHVTPKIASAVMKTVTPAIEMGVPLRALGALRSASDGNAIAAFRSPHFTSENLHTLIGATRDRGDLHHIEENPNFGQEHHKQAIDHFLARAKDTKTTDY